MDKQKFLIQIDSKKYKEKPTGAEIGAIKKRVQGSKPVKLTIKEIMKSIESGCAVSLGILEGGLKAENWKCQQLFGVDIDNDDENIPILQPKEAIDKLKTIDLLPIIYYKSFSSTKNKPKYRLIFAFDEPIVEESKRKIIAETLISLFPQADKACVNADRIYFGTNKEGKVGENVINFEKILELYQPQQAEIKLPSELEELKNKFDFENYLRTQCGIVLRENENSITFKKCPICGHNDCFIYYKDTKTFYCFGKNGSKGGSIIDFLMFTKKLSKNEAIDLFKYQLLKLPKVNNTEARKFDVFSASDLLNENVPAPYWAVENLIYQGVTLLAAPPKYRKSWFSLYLSICVSLGKKFLGFKTQKSRALYLALEDSKSRLKYRLKKVLYTDKVPENLDISNSAGNLENGLIWALEKHLEEKPDTKLIIIDTLQKVRGMSKNQNAYAKDYEDIAQLKALADKYAICIVVVHHLRKPGKSDNNVFNQISGTNGITGAADNFLVIDGYDKETSESKLHITGREVISDELILQFDNETCRWMCLGNAEVQEQKRQKKAYEDNPVIIALKKHLNNNNNIWQGTATELKKALVKYEISLGDKTPAVLAKELKNLKDKMIQYDNIYHTPPPSCGSNGKRIHKFEISSFGRSDDISTLLDDLF